jgi:hypothetical protein
VHRCGQEREAAPLSMSELLSVVGDALRVADGEYAVMDLIGSRARSSLARLQVAVLATRILSVLDRRKVLRWLAQESQIAALDEAWCLPAHEREESSPSGPASGGCAVSDRLDLAGSPGAFGRGVSGQRIAGAASPFVSVPVIRPADDRLRIRSDAHESAA